MEDWRASILSEAKELSPRGLRKILEDSSPSAGLSTISTFIKGTRGYFPLPMILISSERFFLPDAI
jgi:hypothetical protein